VTQDEEDRQLRSVLAALSVVDQWERLTGDSGPSAPADGSDLAADDTSVHPHQVSHAAWAAITAAVSHLGCLRDSLFTQTGPTAFNARLHTHGQFTLVRGALENASHAVWLLESDDREVRRLRRLQQEWAESRQLDEVYREIGEATEDKNARFTRLSPVAEQAGVDPDGIKKTPDYTTIMRAAGGHLPVGPAVTVVIWKACSSLAHGEARGQLIYLTKEVVGQSSPGVALARVTSNVLLLTTGVGAATAMTKIALDLYAKRSGTPNA
jgi:hypothetical protein